MADGSDYSSGTLIADHPDLGTEVVLRIDRDEVEKVFVGKIIEVRKDGMRKIEILEVVFMDGRHELLDVPRIRLVHEDTEYLNGGYLTLEEYERRFD